MDNKFKKRAEIFKNRLFLQTRCTQETTALSLCCGLNKSRRRGGLNENKIKEICWNSEGWDFL